MACETVQQYDSTNGHHNTCSRYLAGIHRDWREGSLRQGNCGAQQVSGVSSFLLVFSAVLHFQLLFRQDSFITRSIPRWRKEFKFSMSPPKQKAYPKKDVSWSATALMYSKVPYQQNTRNKLLARNKLYQKPHFPPKYQPNVGAVELKSL